MKIQKAGCILVNIETKKIGLIYRNKKDDYSFPKGHLEEGETLKECAIRETEEETGRRCHIIVDEEIAVLNYTTPKGKDAECHFYLAVDDGVSSMIVEEALKEELVWTSLEDVESTLTYENLREIWNNNKHLVDELLND